VVQDRAPVSVLRCPCGTSSKDGDIKHEWGRLIGIGNVSLDLKYEVEGMSSVEA
jgi:hypothetical protein